MQGKRRLTAATAAGPGSHMGHECRRLRMVVVAHGRKKSVSICSLGGFVCFLTRSLASAYSHLLLLNQPCFGPLRAFPIALRTLSVWPRRGWPGGFCVSPSTGGGGGVASLTDRAGGGFPFGSVLQCSRNRAERLWHMQKRARPSQTPYTSGPLTRKGTITHH